MSGHPTERLIVVTAQVEVELLVPVDATDAEIMAELSSTSTWREWELRDATWKDVPDNE